MHMTYNLNTMKRTLTFCSLLLLFVTIGKSQVDNYCLYLTEGTSLDGGTLHEMCGADSYTLQWWMNAEAWKEGAHIMGDEAALDVTAGTSQTLRLRLGASTVDVSHAALQPNRWVQLTLLVNQGEMQLLVDGTMAHRSEGDYRLPETMGTFRLGGNLFAGRLDEIRVWSTCITDEYGYFIHNTLNKWVPQLDHLVLYYKCDQNLCPDALVDYKPLFKPSSHNHHAAWTEGAERRLAADNAGLPYLMCGAYTNNNRFFDRAIGRDQYLLANDLIILGIQSYADGHLEYVSPNSHATAVEGEYLEDFEGRKGVLSLQGGKGMVCGSDLFNPAIDANGKASTGYTFETWVYLDKWVEGAYLFKKTGSDGRGFSISLGADSTKQVVVSVNGNRYVNVKCMDVGRWIHFGVTVNAGGMPRTTLMFSYDGVAKWANASVSSGSTDYTPTGMEDAVAVIGEGLYGKLDETVVWNTKFAIDGIRSHMQRVPFPGIGRTETASILLAGSGYYTYDNPQHLGWDLYSQDEWKRIMLSAYDGYRGYQVRISVIGHTGWQNTIADAAKRKTFAADLARLAEGYDGVELDLEWMDGTQTNLGLLTEEIRKALPAEKSLMVSCHAYGAYRFPHNQMDKIDGFTFQQYGPQKTWFSLGNFESSYQSFVNYGFSKDKIYLSYATTTSGPYDDADQKLGGGITGWRNIISVDGYTPSSDMGYRSGAYNGYHYYYQSPEQVYRRAKFVVDNGLKGIFYWDMGNDIPTEHPYSIVRACSYGLNANVDTLVTSVVIQHPTAISTVRAGHLAVRQVQDWLYVESDEEVSQVALYAANGQLVATEPGTRLEVAALPKGIYIARILFHDGRTAHQSFIKK